MAQSLKIKFIYYIKFPPHSKHRHYYICESYWSSTTKINTICLCFHTFSHSRNLTAFMECMKHMKGTGYNIFWTVNSRAERKKLEAIFHLKKQNDTFHINSIEDLEDQLRL